MINIALLGNPNVGKTTIFNSLTGLKQYVGNWPGVTIEKREGFIGDNINIVDLPGIYAMDTFSNEEKISKNYLENEDVDIILNVIDASNLSRNLYLTTQLMKYKKPIIVLLNMTDTAEQKGMNINCEAISRELGCTVIPMVAKKQVNKLLIKKAIEKEVNHPIQYKNFSEKEEETYKEIESMLEISININKSDKKSLSDKIDDIVLNPILAYLVFLGLLYILFKFTFDWVGGPLQELTGGLIDDYIGGPLGKLLANSSEWFNSLIIDGIVGGLGGAIPFFPLIFVLFLGITILEDSGYMSRIAFLMDKIMSKIGLSGKTFIPLIMGMGCASPAIMAARTLDSEKDRKITALMAPLMTCGAKVPIYAIFVSIFFEENQVLVITSLYMAGILVSILVAFILNKSQNNKTVDPFIIELPRYSFPSLKMLLKNTWEKSKGFLVRVCTIMFAMSVVIWFMSSFGVDGFTSEIDNSFLAIIGAFIAPIFKPIGFADWRAGVSIITGISAKEIVVATMEILYGDLEIVLPTVFTTVTAYSFLIFSALYTPCIAVLATMKKEYGTKMMMISALYQFLVAWVAAFYVYQIGTLLTSGFVLSNVITLGVGTIIIGSIFMIVYKKLMSINLSNQFESKSIVSEVI